MLFRWYSAAAYFYRTVIVGMRFFETDVGIKYKNATFHSRQIRDYVVDHADLLDIGVPLDHIVLPPDGLRNKFTWCGKSIIETPHFDLIKDISNGQLTSQSAYVQHCRNGTLDTRASTDPPISYLHQKFSERTQRFDAGGKIEVFAFELDNEKGMVLLDGKHRLALAVHSGKLNVVRVHLVDSSLFSDPFFEAFYATILRAPPEEYSQNQNLIRDML